MDRLLELINEIDDLSLELEELQESGDAEAILAVILKLEELRTEHFHQAELETDGCDL